MYYTYICSFKNNHHRRDWLFVMKIKTKSHVEIEVVEDDNNEVTERENVFQIIT